MLFRRRETERERTLLRLIDSLQRDNALMRDQLLHMVDKTWTPPPVVMQEEPVTLPDELEVGWSAQPEQDPVY